jgi:hypothetical protein
MNLFPFLQNKIKITFMDLSLSFTNKIIFHYQPENFNRQAYQKVLIEFKYISYQAFKAIDVY